MAKPKFKPLDQVVIIKEPINRGHNTPAWFFGRRAFIAGQIPGPNSKCISCAVVDACVGSSCFADEEPWYIVKLYKPVIVRDHNGTVLDTIPWLNAPESCLRLGRLHKIDLDDIKEVKVVKLPKRITPEAAKRLAATVKKLKKADPKKAQWLHEQIVQRIENE